MRDIVSMPSGILYGSFEMKLQTFDKDETSDENGDSSTLLFGHPRWRVSMSAMRDMSLAESSVWETIQLKMKGKANRLAVFDPVRIAPRGTMRGSPTLVNSVGAEAESALITAGAGQAGKTLLLGDFLQIGTGLGTSQLVKLTADTTLDGGGQGTISFGSYLRTGFAAGTAITWDKPVAYYAIISTPGPWSYSTNAPLVSGFSFDLLEQWS